jgi:hypothetical protein
MCTRRFSAASFSVLSLSRCVTALDVLTQVAEDATAEARSGSANTISPSTPRCCPQCAGVCRGGCLCPCMLAERQVLGGGAGRRSDRLGGGKRTRGWIRAGLRAVGGARGGAWRTRAGRCMPPPPLSLFSARDCERQPKVVHYDCSWTGWRCCRVVCGGCACGWSSSVPASPTRSTHRAHLGRSGLCGATGIACSRCGTE